jgi:hypothetical protein
MSSKICLLYIILTLFITSCSENKRSFSAIHLSENEFLNEKIIEYRKLHDLNNGKDNSFGVVTVEYSRKQDTVVCLINMIANCSQLQSTPPSYYDFVDEAPVLYYTGFEQELIFSKTYIKDLDKICADYLANAKWGEPNDDGLSPLLGELITYSSMNWEVVFNDSMTFKSLNKYANYYLYK